MSQQNRSPEEVLAALAAPFDPAEIKWKPTSVKGNRALAIPYVDARVIMDRLDEVVGVINWQDMYEVLPDGSVVCRLKVRLAGEWIVKEDVGGESEQPDEGDRRKAAFSDSLKRAAVKFGIGRFLYRSKPQWVDYDPQRKQLVGTPRLEPSAPGRGADSLRDPAAAKPTGQNAPAPPPAKKDFVTGLQEYDARLAAKGLIRAGELVKHVAAEGKQFNWPADMSRWSQEQVDGARDEVKRFEAAREAARGPAPEKQLEQLDAALDRKGESIDRVLKKFRLKKGESLTCGQVAQALAWLAELPDAAKAV